MQKGRTKKRLLCITFTIILLLVFPFNILGVEQETGSAQSGEIPYQSYTYWQDYTDGKKTPVYSKAMYEVKTNVTAAELGVSNGSKITDLATDNEGNTYLLDSGNSCIYILDCTYALSATLRNLTYNGETVEFAGAKGIFVDGNGLIYIADTENQRVLVIDGTGKVSHLLLLPDSELIPTDFNYRPAKVTVDSKGYTYIASDGSYYGAILYSPKLEFLGFFGANTVKATALDVLQSLWKRLTSNDIKRAADETTLPYAFTDIVIGPDNFVYTATGKSGQGRIQTGQICVFNPGGKDVLGASEFNFADYAVGKYLYTELIQNLSSIDVDNDGYFYALDSTYGRIFWYDEDCNLLSVFGGSAGTGNQKGTFYLPCALALNGTDVLVADSQNNSLTVFGITSFGGTVRSAQTITLSGDFAAAQGLWEKVVALDTNCQLAYRGLAKAHYDSGENETAMKYARLGVDREVYAKAFKIQRTEILENAFVGIFFAAILLIGIGIALKLYIRKKNIILFKESKLKTALSGVLHPADTFRLIKEKNQGSVLISAIILILFYVITVLNDTEGGFAFTVFDYEQYNALYVLMSTVGLVLLWTAANWLVCTLAGGIGKVNEIFVVTCYSLMPVVFAKIVRLVLTHVLVPSEGAFLDIFVAACTLYAAFMLIVGIMRIHDYEFGKFLATTVFTLVGMIIVVFMLFLILMLAQQVYSWFDTLYTEMKYR